MPSASTRARLAPFAPSPRNETPCEVGLAVWLPDLPQQSEPGNVAQLVVGRERSPLLQLGVADADGVRLVFQILAAGGGNGRAGGGDLEALLYQGRLQRDSNITVSGPPFSQVFGKAGGVYDESPSLGLH